MSETGPTIGLHGHGASGGVADGIVHVLLSSPPRLGNLADPITSFSEAQKAAGAHLTATSDNVAAAGRVEASEILKAQSLMAADPMLAESVRSKLDAGGQVDDGLKSACDEIRQTFLTSGSEYLMERADDVEAVFQLIRFFMAGLEPPSLVGLAPGTIIVAETLTAAQTAALDVETTMGFVTETGGPTGHVAIIARSLGVPAVVGTAGVLEAVASGDRLVLDGSTGDVVIRPDAAALAEFEEREARQANRAKAAASYKGARVDFDERPMTIAANVGNIDEIHQAADAAADGIGLFRTEFLFLDRATAPSEEEQVEVYKTAAEAFEDSVVIRMLDIGGDKPADFIHIEDEENPFLGVRGMRVYRDYPDLARTQARAILRSAAHGSVWAMAPMVTTLADLAVVHDLFQQARTELESQGTHCGPVPIGAMVEVPALALISDAAAKHVDFFSIGTNDLTQYTMAADRTGAAVGVYNDPAHPAVLQLCAATAKAARTAGISSSVCGEAASDPALAILFAAMGMDKLSMAANSVDSVRLQIAECDPQSARLTLERCLVAGSAAEVRELASELLGS